MMNMQIAPSKGQKKCVHVIFHLCIIARNVDNGIHGIGVDMECVVCASDCRKKMRIKLRLTRSGFVLLWKMVGTNVIIKDENFFFFLSSNRKITS